MIRVLREIRMITRPQTAVKRSRKRREAGRRGEGNDLSLSQLSKEFWLLAT